MSDYRYLSLHPDTGQYPSVVVGDSHRWISLSGAMRYVEDPRGDEVQIARRDVEVTLHLRGPEWARALRDALTAYLHEVGEPEEPEPVAETVG
jgi:hypothetical protein